MWKAVVSVILLGVSLSAGFIVKDEDFLMFFEKVNVTVPTPGAKTPAESIEFSNNTATVDYTVAPAQSGSKVVTLNFTRIPSSPEVETFSLTFSVNGTVVDYWGVTEIRGTVKGKKDNVVYNVDNGVFFSNIKVEAPMGRSFHCSQFGSLYPGLGQATGNYTPIIEISGLQMEAGLGKKLNTSFSDPWECVGFFTAGIWSGIFVTIFLLIIITWGLAMIMNVKTMDRFDDPKGKPISFGGSE